MTMRTLFGSVEASAADPDGSWAAAQASDAALAAYLQRLAELRARELESAEGQQRTSAEGQQRNVQAISCKAARWGSLKLGPSARVRNSLGLTPVQRRNAR
jgi:hypothetical protein